MRSLTAELDRRRAQDLYRTRQILDGPQGTTVTIGGRRYLSFCSNDYLGLASDPALSEALRRGARTYGVGSGAAHLVSGHSRAHHELEEALAAFTGRARALLFSTGYMANLGVLGALARPGDTIYEDRLNHASLLDAALLARARLRRYPHREAAALEGRLHAAGGERFVVTEGVFSMDGDVAPLPDLAGMARHRGAWLMVDDAHGLGVLGPQGRGTLGHYGLGPAEVPILVGTLGKACGTFGAFVAGDAELIETLIQHARTYVYTTALPSAVACAALAALDRVREDEWRRERLAALGARFRAGARELGLPLGGAPHPGQPATPILPLLLGDAARALRVSAGLRERGILVTAIRPPTVPRGSARLRITLSAAHTEEQVDRLLENLAGLL